MTVDGWRAGCERAMQLLTFGGDGHSVVIHSEDEESILAFGTEKPAFRVLVNTWGSLGAVGSTTGLRPSLTLAPGGLGGAVVSDNITVEHVLNIKRLAYHLRDAPPVARAHGGRLSSGTEPRQPEDSDLVERVVRLVMQEMRGERR